MNKKNILLIALLLFPSIVLFANQDTYRYGIFVASSNGFNEKKLTGAVKNVKSILSIFTEYCKMDEFQLLEDPGNDELTAAFNKASQIIETQNGIYETQFFFYYLGHGLPEGLLLGDELYEKFMIKDQLSLINARIKFIFIDACSSQVMGGNDFLDFNTLAKGTAFISSSALFEQSFFDTFSPILKAGLMGDADGFIPDSFPVNFFYDEILSKLKGDEKDFIQDLYDFKEYYEYREDTPDRVKETEKIFNAIGITTIPPRISFEQLSKEIFPLLPNRKAISLIQKVYNYSHDYSIRKKLSSNEKERLQKILENEGFKKDNFVTLVELFSYIHTRVTDKKVLGQTPTINTTTLFRKEPVRLAYNEKKITILIKYPGTVYVNRLTPQNILEQIIPITPRLGDTAPAKITLSPGQYVFLIEIDGIKYRVDKKISPGDKEIMLEKSDWSSMVVYQEKPEEKRSFSYSIQTALSLPLYNNTSLNPGTEVTLTVLYNFKTSWGTLSTGIMTGINRQTSEKEAPVDLTYLSLPVSLRAQLMARIFGFSFMLLELGGGVVFEPILFSETEKKDLLGIGAYFNIGIGFGVNLLEKMRLAIKGNLAGTYYNSDNYHITLFPGIEFSRKF